MSLAAVRESTVLCGDNMIDYLRAPRWDLKRRFQIRKRRRSVLCCLPFQRGGCPVIKKWLSYREFRVLGRALLQEEMTYITEVVRRLKALLLLSDELDANYRAAGACAMPLE